MTHYKGVWGAKGSEGYIQDPNRPWDDWCVCADCDPDQEHRIAYCADCEVQVEIVENCEHDIKGATYRGDM